MYANARAIRNLEKAGLTPLILRYEDLVFDTDRVRSRLCDFLGVDGSISDIVAHDIYGSRFKNQVGRRLELSYDDTWHANKQLYNSPLFSFVQSYSRRLQART